MSGSELTNIGVLFGWFASEIEGPGLPGGSIIYQGNPSIFQKGPMLTNLIWFGGVLFVDAPGVGFREEDNRSQFGGSASLDNVVGSRFRDTLPATKMGT